MIDTTTPAQLVDELEKNATTATSEGWRTLLTEARHAIAAAVARPDGVIFYRESRPVDPGTVALWAYLSSRWTPAATLGAMLDLHARSITSNPGMAEWLRGADVIAELSAAAAVDAAPADHRETLAVARARASAEAVAIYKRSVAAQLAAVQDHALAAPARAYLDAVTLTERVEAAVVRRAEHERVEAERAAAERAAAQEAADRATDAAEVERLLADELRSHGLPLTLATAGGTYVEAQRERLSVLAPLLRRLKATPVDGVRLARGYFSPRDLALSIAADASRDELVAITRALDRAEGRA